ncbi:MAG: desulfoferrodoxin family protein [Oscillospiraceae bacterium]|nr:desulfoferrodoxin family protein [Oscillospiraceae bacterium]
MKFYLCSHCGNLITHMNDSGVPVVCCGEPMKLLCPNTADAAGEKHLPVIAKDGLNIVVTVGTAEHPMLPEHFIQWILLETRRGCLLKRLNPGEAPKAEFILCEDDEAVAAYAYCNLHGLWKTEV